jgi:hypothetical protein
MTTTATASKAKAIVTSKLMADGTMKTVASKLIVNRIAAATADCIALAKVPCLEATAKAAAAALDALLDECSE